MSSFVSRSIRLAALLAGAAMPAAAQSRLPAIRPLGPILSRATEPLGAVSAAVPLPGGRVLVNDVLQRRVVMFDSTLAQVTVVADSTSATANAYGQRGGGLIGYRGDSALFIDPASLSMTTVSGRGELTTVRAVPRANEIQALTGAQGRPGFDPQGRLVHRATPRPRPAARAGHGLGHQDQPAECEGLAGRRRPRERADDRAPDADAR
jgi:hypothetical protein